jgi:DNA-binding SARP family transcriptional activator/tetratricopeptide (TPR) repeat protein
MSDGMGAGGGHARLRGEERVQVRLRLLGPVEVAVGDRPVELGHARQTSVLAALAIDANRVVSTEQLVERVWAEKLPHRAPRVLSSYLSRLRGLLSEAHDLEIVRRLNGYVLEMDPDAIDLHRFRDLVTKARSGRQPGESLAAFDQATALWRGDALTGLDGPWATGTRQALDQERLAAELDRTDIALRLGKHHAVLPEVSVRAAAHPLDERLAAQLMLALYRCGRQADALDWYQRTRLLLADELGTDPGSALRQLHHRLLTADHALDLPAAAPSSTASAPVPRQLPAPPPWFTGRKAELAALTEALDSHARQHSMTVCAISGTGGLGKTALALTWAHQARDRFPDGQLYVNLRGFDPTSAPVQPQAALRGFLEALGVPPAHFPSEVAGQSAMYRSLLSDKKILVVLDNVRDTAQLEALLPGSATCAVLVTSRRQLAGLSAVGADRFELDSLTAGEARELLAGHLGAERVDAEPEAVADLVDGCVGLPLAICTIAARAATQRGFPLAAFATELKKASTRLDALDAGDLGMNVRAVLSSSYRALDDDVARVFRLLATTSAADVAKPAIDVLVAGEPAGVSAAIRTLVDLHLLEEHVPGRYRLHDLLRTFGLEIAATIDTPAALDEAQGRLAGWYATSVRNAVACVYPAMTMVATDWPDAGAAHPFSDSADARRWLDLERDNLVAALVRAAEGRLITRDVLSAVIGYICRYTIERGHPDSGVAVVRATLTRARAEGQPVHEARALVQLGTAALCRNDLDAAAEHLVAASAGLEGTGLRDEAAVWNNLGTLYDARHEPQKALDCLIRARTVFSALGDRLGNASVLNNLGRQYCAIGEYRQAIESHRNVVELARELPSTELQATASNNLGDALNAAGRGPEALDSYQTALRLARECRQLRVEAYALAALGRIFAAGPEPSRGLRHLELAAELYDQIGDRMSRTTVLADLERHRIAPHS